MGTCLLPFQMFVSHCYPFAFHYATAHKKRLDKTAAGIYERMLSNADQAFDDEDEDEHTSQTFSDGID